jgi:solute carrier family 25 citrate transporter 1
MQSIESKKNYKNSFACAATIFKNEGILTFWSGAVPRLARLVVSGGIVFTMYVSNPCDPLGGKCAGSGLIESIIRYEKSMELMDRFDPERKYL